jgi:hypothetical protein
MAETEGTTEELMRSWTIEAVVGLVVVMGACLLQTSSCRCSNDGPTAPDASVQPPDASSTATQGVLTDAGPDALEDAGPGWEPVLELEKVEGSWGGEDEGDTLIIITSRAASKQANQRWPYPYPWHVHIADPANKHPEPYDCGFHTDYQDAKGMIGWRVAYCQGGHWGLDRRHATTLWLYTKELPSVELVKARLGSDAEAVATRR